MTFAQLGLPPIAKSFKFPAIWTIRVIRYLEDERKIYCEIISYQNGETEFGYEQIILTEKLNLVETVTFRSIDTDALLKTLAGSVAVSFTRLPDRPVERSEHRYVKLEPAKKDINETFHVPINNVSFKDGYACITVKFNELKKAVELSIANEEIREEFDAVKNYIGNVLGTKRITVSVKIELGGDQMSIKEVSSPEISRIDREFFEKVKFEFVRSVLKKKVNFELDKALFTMEEYFEAFVDQRIKSSVFYTDAGEMLDDVLKFSNTKHYKNLRFLSSRHSHKDLKLRFVQSPFSFVFLIAGKNNYHVIWETLDTTQATYVWHLEKDSAALMMTLDKIDQIINHTKHQGRKSYLNSEKEPFTRIFHDYSDNVEGFLKWKDALEAIIR